MNDILSKLPIGIQTFEKLITGGYIYIDKTALISKLASSQAPCLFTRPRNFGKSLLLSTLSAYFEGKKELFEGLAIATTEKDWKQYPVLHLDLNAENYDSPQALSDILSRHLSEWEQKYGKGKDETTLCARFAGVIQRASEQAGTGVVRQALTAHLKEQRSARRLSPHPELLLRSAEKLRPPSPLRLTRRNHPTCIPRCIRRHESMERP